MLEGLRRRVFAKDHVFYDLFLQAASNLRAGVEKLSELIYNYQDVADKIKSITEIEHRGDDITHQILHHINIIFVTRFDHEDIAELTKTIDDIMDLVEAAAERFQHFNIPEPTEAAEKLIEILRSCVSELESIIAKLNKPRTIDHKALERIHEWENQADELQRRAAAESFRKAEQAIDSSWQDYARALLLAERWHTIYQRLENAIDKCEDAADVIERMITKYG